MRGEGAMGEGANGEECIAVGCGGGKAGSPRRWPPPPPAWFAPRPRRVSNRASRGMRRCLAQAGTYARPGLATSLAAGSPDRAARGRSRLGRMRARVKQRVMGGAVRARGWGSKLGLGLGGGGKWSGEWWVGGGWGGAPSSAGSSRPAHVPTHSAMKESATANLKRSTSWHASSGARHSEIATHPEMTGAPQREKACAARSERFIGGPPASACW